MGDWKLLEKKKIFDNAFRPIEEWHMRLPGGGEHRFAVERSHDIVVIFGMTKDQRVLVIREYYIGVERHVTALVAGLVEGGDHRETAEQELRQESGCTAGEFVYLGSSLKGKYVTGSVHFYLALGVAEDGSQALEPAEDIQVLFVSVEELKRMLRESELQGAYEVACAYRALDYLKFL